jgi:hypothetical protein
LKFFTTENFPNYLATLLKAYPDSNNEIQVYLDVYPPGEPDHGWISCIGKERPKPVILSADGEILSNAVARKLLLESGCSFVYLAKGWRKQDYHLNSWKLIRYWPGIVNASQGNAQQMVLEISINGVPRRVIL